MQARYGPPYKPYEVRLAWCWGPDDLAVLTGKGDQFLFKADYGIPGTCPGEVVIVWKYDFLSLAPEGYAWGSSRKGEWRRFYTTPLSTLARENEANNPYEGK